MHIHRLPLHTYSPHREDPTLTFPASFLTRQKKNDGGDDDGVIFLSDGYTHPRRDHRLLFLGAMLVHWAGGYVLDPKKQKKSDVLFFFLREALKLKARDTEDLILLYSLLPRFDALLAPQKDGNTGEAIEIDR